MNNRMITIDCGRPSELIRSLRTLNPVSVHHLCINVQDHFWYTDDNIEDMIQEFIKFPNLVCLEFNGNSFPTLAETTHFLTFLTYNACNLRSIKMPILAPYPGQYRIQDRNFMVNKILHIIFNHQSLFDVKFYSPPNTLRHPDSTNDWTNHLNNKVKCLIRNHQNMPDSKL